MPYYYNQDGFYIIRTSNSLIQLIGSSNFYVSYPENIKIRSDPTFLNFLELIIDNLEHFKSVHINVINEYLMN